MEQQSCCSCSGYILCVCMTLPQTFQAEKCDKAHLDTPSTTSQSIYKKRKNKINLKDNKPKIRNRHNLKSCCQDTAGDWQVNIVEL